MQPLTTSLSSSFMFFINLECIATKKFSKQLNSETKEPWWALKDPIGCITILKNKEILWAEKKLTMDSKCWKMISVKYEYNLSVLPTLVKIGHGQGLLASKNFFKSYLRKTFERKIDFRIHADWVYKFSSRC